MKVESLKTAPDRAGRYWVTFDDGSRMGLYRQTVEDFALYSGKELDEQEAEALRTAAGQMSAKMRAVRIVSAFPAGTWKPVWCARGKTPNRQRKR